MIREPRHHVDDDKPGSPDDLVIEPGFLGWFQEDRQAISVLWMVLIYVTVLSCFLSYLFAWRLLAQDLVWALGIELIAVAVAIRVRNQKPVRRGRHVQRVETRVAIGRSGAIGLAILAIAAYNVHCWPRR
jgi:hypothetical protein